jgi:hypothetical protein
MDGYQRCARKPNHFRRRLGILTSEAFDAVHGLAQPTSDHHNNEPREVSRNVSCRRRRLSGVHISASSAHVPYPRARISVGG